MPKVRVGDIHIYYEILGQGEPLVMIMGRTGNLDWWDPRMISELKKYFTLILFDNRGTGRSEKGEKPFSIKLFADDTVGLMDALGIAKANILGISLGGAIAIEIALSYPEKVKKLVLASTTCGSSKGVVGPGAVAPIQVLDKLEANPREFLEEMLRRSISEEWIRENPCLFQDMLRQVLIVPISKDVWLAQSTAALQWDACNRLSQIRVPTLIVHGKKDQTLPVENAYILAQGIPNAKLVILENSSHTLVEEIDKASKEIVSFLLNDP
jgi:pimeloyl-ACP methyl ester carboxylesterase